MLLTWNDLRAVDEAARLPKNCHLCEGSGESGTHAGLVINETLPGASRAVVAGEEAVRGKAYCAWQDRIERSLHKELRVKLGRCAIKGITMACASDPICSSNRM